MKIYLIVNDNNIITGYSYKNLANTIEFDTDNPEAIKTGLDTYIDGKVIPGIEAASVIKQRRISELKSLLATSDYMCMKHADGDLTDEEYAEIKAQRHAWRVEINELEASLSE